LSGRQIQQRLGVSKTVLQGWLRGLPPPEWTRRPTAKDDLHPRATELRLGGWSVNDIAIELGIAKSTAWQWIRHLPLDRDSERARLKRAHAKLMTDAQWRVRRKARDDRRAAAREEAGAGVGDVSERELLLIGAAIYWCEGKKAKPWRPDDCRILVTNSDPDLIAIFLRFVESQGHACAELSYRVSIHESADAVAATTWWADRFGLPLDRFKRPTLKRHNPLTNRLNTSADYHGCLVIDVPRSRETYWRVEGIMGALSSAVEDRFGGLGDRG